MMNPFTPGATVSRAVTSTTANVALGTGGLQVRVVSPAGGAIAFIKFGADNTVEAAVTDTPILPGTIEVLTRAPGAAYVAAIGTNGTTLYFTTGDGQ